MHPQTITEVVDEIREAIVGRSPGSILQLDRLSLVIDFRTRDKDFLLLSVDPQYPRIYLISRPPRQLEKQAAALSPFAQTLRSELAGGKLLEVKKDEHERIVRLSFRREEETGATNERELVAQLTGRSANLLLLDKHGTVLHRLRPLRGEGQQVGAAYTPPPMLSEESNTEPAIPKNTFASTSAAADAFYQSLEANRTFDAQAASARARLRQEIVRLRKLQQHLESDLADHGDPEEHKRLGDLLLANVATAKRRGSTASLTNYYADGAPTIELEVDEQTSLQDEAGKYFARYGKAKRARLQIRARLDESNEKLAELERQQLMLQELLVRRDEEALAVMLRSQNPKVRSRVGPPKRQGADKIPGTRSYLSSDGYEIVVGRAAKDNDHLTFRVARPYDLWLHAANYPGSHVIVRNPKRHDVPHRTLIEAAQLAAKFSQAGNDTRVDVHHTLRKFVSRIKGAAPGLVRLSSFKTIAVQPGEPIERI